MSDEITYSFSIPADSDGFVLLKCSLCQEFFKITPSDYEDDSQIEVWCPKCGLVPDSLLTEDVLELMDRTINNHFVDLLDDFDKKMKKTFNSKSMKYTSKSKQKKEVISTITPKSENLEINTYNCCHKEAKINPNLKLEGGYCPFCGEMQDGN